MAQRTITLDGQWRLTFGRQTPDAPLRPEQIDASGWPTIPSTVPGNVELDVIAAGLLPRDLHKANNIYRLRDWEAHRWWYRREFPAVAAAADQRVVLELAGVDCVGEVFINGRSAGCVDNMLIEHRLDVTGLLHPHDANQIAVRIDSAVLAGRQHRPEAVSHALGSNWESLRIRKAPHMYGWDILPRVVSAGLWRGVRLIVQNCAGIDDVHWMTVKVDAEKRTGQMLLDYHLRTDLPNLDDWTLRITLNSGAQQIHAADYPVLESFGRVHLGLRDVSLWWPAGSGEAVLHDAAVLLVDPSGKVVDRAQTRVGIRTIELQRTPITDSSGSGEFVFVVNGRKVYCRGTNHVPLDSLHSRDPDHLPGVMAMLSELNCNMVRCWGGNVYEDHAFFDYCDQQGILVWQDFALACAVYPQDHGFAAAIRREAESVVRKLRNHCSLALWAGNNEVDQAYSWSGVGTDPNADVLSRQVLPEVVRRLDPTRPYLPSSPYYSPEVIRCGDTRRAPEDHLWGPRDDFRGPYYSTPPAHFVSEIGYHGCPARESLEQMMDADHLWPWQGNDQWLTHAVRPLPAQTQYDYRIPLMARQIRVLFDADPDNIDDFVLASQISQAEAVKFFIERWRMGKWRRTGMLWWNLRDGWPVISDAVVDYFGRRKLAYSHIRASQQTVCVCIGDPEDGAHPVVAANDGPQAVTLQIVVSDADSERKLLDCRCEVPGDCAKCIGSVAPSQAPAMWLIRWRGDRSGQNHRLAGPLPMRLADYRRWLSGVGS